MNVSVNSEYAEIAEVVLCDVLPTIAGCALLGSHFLVQVRVLLGWALPACLPGCCGPPVSMSPPPNHHHHPT